MATLKSFSYYEINVIDKSIYEPVVLDQLPLHRPFYIMKTQKGETDIPVWYPRFTDAERALGSETFNINNPKYFSPAAYFLLQSMQHDGAFIARVAADDAKKSLLILEAVVEMVNVPQYRKTASGSLELDGSGNPISLTDGGGAAIVEAGVKITWNKRTAFGTLGSGDPETAINLEPVTVGGVTTYPILVFEATSTGDWGNDVGFSLFYDKLSNSEELSERSGGCYTTIAPVRKDYGSSIVDSVRDKYNQTQNVFVFKPNAVDSATQQAISMSSILENNYNAGEGLPYNVTVYSDNIKSIGTLIVAAENELISTVWDGSQDPVEVAAAIAAGEYVFSGLTDAWKANIISAYDLDGFAYDNTIVEYGTASLRPNVTHYLGGGDDGDISDATIEELIINYLQTDIYPAIVDKPRYPITHLFDVGYPLDVKYAMISFLDIRDDVKVVMATHDNSIGPNTEAQDESLLAALHSRALLMRESVLMGTAACRCDIFTQSGRTHDNYVGFLPTTLWSAYKHAEYQNKTYLDREMKGLPNSAITMFKEFNWTPIGDGSKARKWNLGGNYCQYYDMTSLHYPSVRSVYPYDTSVLVDAEFVDCIVYMKHIVRQSWAVHVGLTKSFAILKQLIETDLSGRLNDMIRGKYVTETTVYQTDEEKKIGFIDHVLVKITSPATSRVWLVDIECHRENYEG